MLKRIQYIRQNIPSIREWVADERRSCRCFKRGPMKKIRLVVGIAAAAIVVLLIAGLLLINPNRYRGAIQTQLESRLGRQFTLGDMSLGLFPLRLQVSTPVIGEDAKI